MAFASLAVPRAMLGTAAEGHRAPAVFLDRTAALLAAAVQSAGAALNPLHVAEKVKRLGLPIHDGRRPLGRRPGSGPTPDGS